MTLPDDPRLTTLHADMDAFFAAVEVLDDPSLAGKPLIIGHPGRRGVVSTASYEARRFGVHSALPSVEALRRCPGAEWRAPRLSRYAELSRRVRDVFRSFTPLIEPLSLDEAFLDVAGSRRLHGGAVRIAELLRAAVREATGGLTVSVGVAENKFLAKLASDLQKPDGLTVVPPGDAEAFLAPLEVERLWGVGAKTARRLHALGLKRIGEVAAAGEAFLRSQLGPATGTHLHRLSHGLDNRSVESEHDARSVSTESTFAADIHDLDDMKRFLFEASDVVSEALRQANLKARTVQLKVRTGTFRTHTRARTLPEPTDLLEDLYHTAVDLLIHKVELRGEGVRLLGVGGKGLIEAAQPIQGTLFGDDPDDERRRLAAELSDRIRDAHGHGALIRGRQLSSGLRRMRHPASESRVGRNDPGRIRRRDLADDNDGDDHSAP